MKSAHNMVLARFRIIAICMAATVASGFAYQSSPSGTRWPPPVQKGPEGSPALSPAEALKTFSMPPGYRIELVASEPEIVTPIGVTFDPQGRLLVNDLGNNEAEISYIGDKTRKVWSKWAENDGKFQIVDVKEL